MSKSKHKGNFLCVLWRIFLKCIGNAGVDMKSSDKKKAMGNLFQLGFTECITYINAYVSDTLYESFMAQKLLQKLYFNKVFHIDQKEEILQCLESKFSCYQHEIRQNYKFIEIFFPIAYGIHSEIEELETVHTNVAKKSMI